MIKLFVGGFPLEMNELEIVKLFSLHGDVSTIKIVRDKRTKICKGYAFLEMKDQQSADNAVEALDNYPIGDRHLTVKIREDEPVAPPTSYNRPKPSYSKPSSYGKPSYQKPSYSAPAAEPDRKKRPRKII